jgi:hypothetical protein
MPLMINPLMVHKLDDFPLEDDDVLEKSWMLSQEDFTEVIRILAIGIATQYADAVANAREELERLRRSDKKKRSKKSRPSDEDTQHIRVNTLYKRKGVKIHPIDDLPSDGSVPEGDPHWKSKKMAEIASRMEKGGKYSDFLTPKFSTLEKGSRLTKERLAEMVDQTNETLSKEEQDIFATILYNREAALAWDFEDCGRVDPAVAPPQVIKVVPHKAWQAGSIPIPLGLRQKVIDLLRQRLRRGILEEGHGSYRNPFMLVAKKDGGIRLINSATRINRVTIRDSLSPPGTEEFSADVAMCQMLSLLDFFSGYDQVSLAKESRDLTTFMTPLGLLRMCTLPQGATNSVAQFTRIITRILFDLIPDICTAFLDDIVVKGPTTTYNNEESSPGVRRYVKEHLINLDQTLLNIELAGCTVSVPKSQFCRRTALVVGYLCGTHGRSPEEAKVIKITEWTCCDSDTEVRAFLGVTGYYRIWVAGYATIAKPLTSLLKKDAKFIWGDSQAKAMQTLKRINYYQRPSWLP